MKTILQTLFFLLMVTQICLAQRHQQTSGTNFNTKNGITDRMDKHHKIMGANIHSGKNNEFSTPKFNDKLPGEIDPFEVNNTSYPFQNDRTIPDDLQKNSPSIIRMLSSQSQFYVIDTAIVLRLGFHGDPGDTTRHLYSFNLNAKKTSDLTQKLNGDTWVNSTRLSNEYDEANNMLLELYEYWENGQWVNSNRWTYTYDAQGNRLTEFFESWENGQWVYSNRGTFTYDAQGNRLSEFFEYWENGQWVYSNRGTFTYDAQGNRLSEFYESWQNGQLMNSSRNTYTYDAQGNRLTELHQYWENSQLVNSSRITYTYDTQGNRLSELYEDLQNGQWVNSYRGTYTYDEQGNMLLYLSEYWENGQWVYSQRSTYTYDTQGNLTSLWNHSWQNSAWTPADFHGRYGFSVVDNAGNYYDLGRGYNFTLSYKMIVTEVESEIGNVPGTYTLSQNYPNPFNPNTRIKYSIPKSSQVTLKIFNTLGEEIKTLVNEEKPVGIYELTWNAANLPSGVYFYQLKTGEYINTKKMVLLK